MKKELGQFYTITNPFTLEPFVNWLNNISNIKDIDVIEPFAGANNIPKMIPYLHWKCYDIEPNKENVCPQFTIEKLNTISNFPKGFAVAITNPPYLGKSSAKRMKLKYEYPEYDDLYKKCIEVMLNNCKYVAAIIPESFITAKEFKERLNTVISLSCKMFDDTACPVCLALFNPEKTNNFSIYSLNTFIGNYNDLLKFMPIKNNKIKIKLNDPTGIIGIHCIDNTIEDSIFFTKGDNINPSKIKGSSRSITRANIIIPNIINENNIMGFIQKCNEILFDFRKNTNDVFLTSFKCLREDGKYRRRLDYDIAKRIINEALKQLSVNKLF